MTTEEAIKELKDASDSEVRYGDTEHHYNEVMKRIEAFDMAIKALKQQPCDDCISRQEQKSTSDYIKSISKPIRVMYCDAYENKDDCENGSQELCKQCIHLKQPCDNCISRQAVLDMATTIQTDDFSGNEIIEVVDVDDIKELQPVTPTRPTGRWIRWYEVIESADGKSTDHIPHCKCSECGTEYDPHSSQFIKYCNECGAMMRR